MHLLVKDVVSLLEDRYPPAGAEPWDTVGLVAGNPEQEVRSVLFAIDPVSDVVAEAVEAGVDLLVTHHPLFLHGVTSVAATTPKGRVVHDLVRAGIALYVAHTSADSAAGGVNDALAGALGLTGTRPLVPADREPLDVITTFVPEPDADAVVDALAAAGAGAVGNYERCVWSVAGTGEFTAGLEARPTIGSVGTPERLEERRVEMVLRRSRRAAVVAALRAAHPYEEPAFSVVEMAALAADTGTGRVGTLAEAMTLEVFARRVATVLPATAQGIRVAGDLTATVRTVAVCGGSGDAYLEDARRAGADVYVTADLRHHRASEARSEDGAPFLIDAAHWASEWVWLPVAARVLEGDAARAGAVLWTRVSSLVTDPWTVRLGGPDQGGTP